MRRISLLLQDLLDVAAEAAALVQGRDADTFIADPVRVRAGERCVFIIGEAARQLPEVLRDRHPQAAWREIIGMRNVLAHAYFRVDTAILYQVLWGDLPELVTIVRRMLEEGGFPDSD